MCREGIFEVKIVKSAYSDQLHLDSVVKRKPDKGERYYGIKNRMTREYKHSFGYDNAEAVTRLGWRVEDCFVTLIVDGDSIHGTMSEATKARLKAYNRERRSSRGTAARESRPDPLHSHECPTCQKNFF